MLKIIKIKYWLVNNYVEINQIHKSYEITYDTRNFLKWKKLKKQGSLRDHTWIKNPIYMDTPCKR